MKIATLIFLLLATSSVGALSGQTKKSEAKSDAAPSQAVTTPSGLKYVDLVVGKGPMPKDGNTVDGSLHGALYKRKGL